MFPSAFASLRSDPVSRAYCQRKRNQGKRRDLMQRLCPVLG